jgi:thioredoxin 1
MGNTVAVTDSNFEEVVLKSTNPVLVDFWATWCRPCQMVAPILEDLTSEYGDKLVIAKLDVDQNQQIAQKYRVMSIPTMIVFVQGKRLLILVGFKPKDKLKQELDAALDRAIQVFDDTLPVNKIMHLKSDQGRCVWLMNTR